MIAIVGAGPVGLVTGLFLSRQDNTNVTIIEARPKEKVINASGRSINLALSHRGLTAIKQACPAAYEKIMQLAIPVVGRMVHQLLESRKGIKGKEVVDEYGGCIYSVSRNALMEILLSEAGRSCAIRFQSKVDEIVFGDLVVIRFADGQGELEAEKVIGCDGVNSAVRKLCCKGSEIIESKIRYKEIYIPPDRKLSPKHLHIWPNPQGGNMFMALPNADGSFTGTLFSENREESVESILKDYSNHLLKYVHLEELFDEWLKNEWSALCEVRRSDWSSTDDRIIVIGDAAHAMLPFFGQGLNCGLEDARLLSKAINDGISFEAFAKARQPDTLAIQTLSRENWAVMNGGELAFGYRLDKLRIALMRFFSPEITGLYQMVTFTDIPYGEAVRIYAKWKRMFLLCTVITLLMVILVLYAKVYLL